VLAAAPLAALLLLTGCGSEPPVQADPAEPCTSLPPADPKAVLPADFPALADQVLYGPASQGKTRILFGRVPGKDFLAQRDDLVDRLRDAGYTIESTDQEAVEAEAFFTGPHDGTIKVQRLCVDQLEVRYKLES
jgi:hypothetical protein